MFRQRGPVFAFILVSLLLTACFGEQEDPFTRLPEEPTETLEGRVFPFSVSVSTQATHRLEKDGKLEAYLASKIVHLEDFEGREVSVEGVRRAAKMREVFWVESIKVKDVKQGKDGPKDLFFQTKSFGFTYPEGWEYTTAPDGTAHFIDRSDEARRVFLTFSVQDLDKEDEDKDPNVLIANMVGIQETSEDMGQNRRTITLISNLYDRKYVFLFRTRFEDFEKKTAFFKLLNSFVEGESNVRRAEEKYQKALAQAESDKINGTEVPVVTPDPKPEAPKAEPVPTQTSASFNNLITEKAFLYESSYYGFSMKVPWGFWFRNFGQNESTLARIGFADNEMSGEEDSEFWLEILGDQDPVTAFSEQRDGEQLILEFPRNNNSFFRMTGPESFRDAMLSIHSTIE